MGKVIFAVCLLISINVKSQNQSYKFDGYFIKSKAITADRIVKFYQTMQIEDLGNNHFKVQGDIGPDDNIIAALTFTKKSFFVGRTYFEYSGQGLLSGNQVKFIIESGRDLKDFASGIGYPQSSNEDLSHFEIKLYYWPFANKEPLLKSHFAIYPIKTDNPKLKEQEIVLEVNISEQIEVDSLRQKDYLLSDYYPKQYDYIYGDFLSELKRYLRGFSKRQLNLYHSKFNAGNFRVYNSYRFQPPEHLFGSAKVTYSRNYNSDIGQYFPEVKADNSKIKEALNVRLYEIPLVCLELKSMDDCIEVNTVVEFINLVVDIKRGVTVVRKYVSGKYKFYEDLNKTNESKIMELMRETDKGKYLVSYQLGTINKNPLDEIALEKI